VKVLARVAMRQSLSPVAGCGTAGAGQRREKHSKQEAGHRLNGATTLAGVVGLMSVVGTLQPDSNNSLIVGFYQKRTLADLEF